MIITWPLGVKGVCVADLAGRVLRRRHAGAREGLLHRRRDPPLLRARRRRELPAKNFAGYGES
jgi:hypothetical protein